MQLGWEKNTPMLLFTRKKASGSAYRHWWDDLMVSSVATRSARNWGVRSGNRTLVNRSGKNWDRFSGSCLIHVMRLSNTFLISDNKHYTNAALCLKRQDILQVCLLVPQIPHWVHPLTGSQPPGERADPETLLLSQHPQSASARNGLMPQRGRSSPKSLQMPGSPEHFLEST